MAPDGSPGWYVACEQTNAYCFDEAQRRCPYGYAVLDRGDQSGSVAQSYRNGFTGQVTTVAQPTHLGTMIVRCNMLPGGYQAGPQ